MLLTSVWQFLRVKCTDICILLQGYKGKILMQIEEDLYTKHPLILCICLGTHYILTNQYLLDELNDRTQRILWAWESLLNISTNKICQQICHRIGNLVWGWPYLWLKMNRNDSSHRAWTWGLELCHFLPSYNKCRFALSSFHGALYQFIGPWLKHSRRDALMVFLTWHEVCVNGILAKSSSPRIASQF